LLGQTKQNTLSICIFYEIKLIMARVKLSIILLLTAFILNGCIVYHLDIPQGNEITQDQVDKLRPGLTKAQVQYLLGSSLLRDPFHANRWDYVYLATVNGTVKTEKKFTVFFDGDQLVRWEGEVLPLSERARLRAESDAAVASQIASRVQDTSANG
jgi:outer membrane protein assembly factor BamE